MDSLTGQGSSPFAITSRSEEHTSELQSHLNLVCRLLLEKKKTPDHDGGALCHPQIALAQLDTLPLSQIDQLLDRSMRQQTVSRIPHRFLIHRLIHHDPIS